MLSKYFNPNESFLSLKILWAVVAIHFFLAAIVTFFICMNTPLKLDLSSTGFNSFISIFRFPLSILALIIPIVALLAANHRSEQTKEQIRVSNNQNLFQNYYKHLEEFIKYSEAQNNKALQSPRHIHRLLFPNVSSGKYELDHGFIEKVETALHSIFTKISLAYDSNSGEYSYTTSHEQKKKMSDLTSLFQVTTNHTNEHKEMINNLIYKDYKHTPANYYFENIYTVALASTLSKEFIKLANFDTNYTPSENIKNLASFPIIKYKENFYNPNAILSDDIKQLLKEVD